VALLQLSNCTLRFEGLTAVSDFSLAMQPGELVGLIGPNGAGKTTVFNMVTGAYRPQAGRIVFDGRSIVGLKPHQIAALGIARTFQNVRLFGALSVLDNVRIAAHHTATHGLARTLLRTARFRSEEARITREALRLLRLLGLSGVKADPASALPYGLQRRLEIARGLATRPRLLLLDEPTAGMTPVETESLMHLIKGLRDDLNLTILLIEHDMRVVMGICERVVVLDHAVQIAEGTPEAIRSDPAVIEAYLGEVNEQPL
jgi:branched-chain amino acid transport system ATP-binding protein